LGHSSITLTIDTYSHVMPGLEEAVGRSIDDVMGDAVAANPWPFCDQNSHLDEQRRPRLYGPWAPLLWCL